MKVTLSSWKLTGSLFYKYCNLPITFQQLPQFVCWFISWKLLSHWSQILYHFSYNVGSITYLGDLIFVPQTPWLSQFSSCSITICDSLLKAMNINSSFVHSNTRVQGAVTVHKGLGLKTQFKCFTALLSLFHVWETE